MEVFSFFDELLLAIRSRVSLDEMRTSLSILGGNEILAVLVRVNATCQWLSIRHAFL